MARIIPLSEGSFTVDGTKKFLPFDTTRDTLAERSRGSLLVEIQPFLVITDKDCILLDTGLGFEDAPGQIRLHQLMRSHGVDPSSVTRVLMSHLHKDHAGGIQRRDEATGEQTLNFPNATYYVNARELEYGFAQDGKSYDAGQFSLLREAPNVVLTAEEGEIGGNIRYQMTGGHCPYHQVFWITDGPQEIFFAGDVAPQLSQIKNRFIAKYDYDGRRSMELRQAFVQEGTREGWTFLFYHDIRTPMTTLGGGAQGR